MFNSKGHQSKSGSLCFEQFTSRSVPVTRASDSHSRRSATRQLCRESGETRHTKQPVVLVALLLVISAASALAQPGSPDRSSTKDEKAQQDGPTAEDVLGALQRERPTQELLYPVGISPPNGGYEGNGLLPEGMTLVDEIGTLERQGEVWQFVLASPGVLSSVTLLPNAVVEAMIQTAGGARDPIAFVVSGELTVYDGRNYLLPRVAQRAAVPQQNVGRPHASETSGDGLDSYHEQSSPSAPSKPDNLPFPSADQPSRSTRTAGAPESVEDVLAALQAARPDRQAMTPVEIKPDSTLTAPAADEPGSLAQESRHQRKTSLLDRSSTGSGLDYRPSDRAELRRTLRPDGTVYPRRAGRVVSRGDRWYFAPQSDHPENPEPPFELLPCLTTEVMIRTWRENPHGLVFTVSGELTLFEGENYLLPRMATRRVASDNLRH
jgi:hypothetical protein